MGKLFSKAEKRRPKVQSVADNSEEEDSTVNIGDKNDQMAIKKLRSDFNNDMDMFLLNQIVMSVMFFQNYDTEIAQLSNKKGFKDLNRKLLKEFQKSCIKPDVIAKLVNQYIKFKPEYESEDGQQKEGGVDDERRKQDGQRKVDGPEDERRKEDEPEKDTAVPLLHRRMLIIHDNIEIISEAEDGHYSGIDKPTFKAIVVDADKKEDKLEDKKPGYVMLKHVVEDPRTKTTSISSNSTSDSDPNFDKKNNEEEDFVAYYRINEARTPKPLTSSTGPMGLPILPEKFSKSIHVKNFKRDDDNEENLYITEQYLDSKELMTHFRKKSFQVALWRALGFKLEDVKEAMYTNTSIHCRNYSKGNLVHWEIIPAVTIPWPESETTAWLYHIRTGGNRILKNNKIYTWPSTPMWKEITGMTCIVIPRGFMPKRGVNEQSNLEWEIGFPKAERYLETHMAHAHMRAFLILTALFKTFIEPVTDKKGILVDHIRNHIFLEIEKNPIDWPENRLGTKLKKVLKSLIESMGASKMSDYFIRDKNLFANIPGPFLREAQKQLHDVEQAPVMPFIVALRNLRYIHNDFYPVLDFKYLHETLVNNTMQKNKHIRAKYEQMAGLPVTARDKIDGVQLSDREHRKRKEYEWRMRKLELERKQKLKRNEESEQKRANLNKPHTNEINLKWTSGNQEEDITKGRLILMFFLNHFLAIVKSSIRYGATAQGQLYLKQCDYLTVLLSEEPSGMEDANVFKSKIMELQKELDGNNTNPPSTPARNSYYLPQTFAFDNATDATTVKKKPKSVKIIDATGISDVHVPPSPKKVVFIKNENVSEI